MQRYWAAVEAQEADLVASLFLPRSNYFLNQSPGVQGPAAIRRAFVQLFAETAAIRHRPISVWSEDGLTVADADVTVELDSGSLVQVPATTVLCSKGRGIEAFRFLFNQEPALARATLGFLPPRVPATGIFTAVAGRPGRSGLARYRLPIPG
jgi:hypothetical protein